MTLSPQDVADAVRDLAIYQQAGPFRSLADASQIQGAAPVRTEIRTGDGMIYVREARR